jgi:protease-4
VIRGESGPKIVLIDIDGVITESSGEPELFGPPEESTVARVREQLERAREDEGVRALLLRINSPGGTVTASDIIHQEVLRFKRERGLPVVAHFLGIAASGAYYVAMAADEVIAQPTAVTGSIGVIFVGLNLTQLMDKVGIEDQTLTAGQQKDAGSWLRPMKPDERVHLQAILDDMHARFKQVVVQGRPRLDAARVDALSDGRIFSSDQALASGLIDGHGDLEDAVAAAQRRAGLEKSRVVTYHRPREYRQNLYTRAPMVPPRIRLELAPSLPFARPGFLYLWAPGAP